MVHNGRSGCSSGTHSARPSFGRTIMGKAIRESSFQSMVGTKVPNWERLFVDREKGLFLLCVCGRYKTGWKETGH